MPKLYDFELMMGSGKLCGYGIQDRELEQGVVAALEQLAQPEHFRRKYGLERDYPVLLYAMGDGNHSLATAKAIWESVKAEVPDPADVMDSPARYALVELVNIYDASLVFEPIHRVLFELRQDLLAAMRARFGASLRVQDGDSMEALTALVDELQPGLHRVGYIDAAGLKLLEISDPPANLAVGTLQGFLDAFMVEGGAGEIDYVHGTDVVHDLGQAAGNAGFYLPAMGKDELFPSVILDGALPRKTFSMGEAHEKRFYLECRQLG